jgi:hypothetical protein
MPGRFASWYSSWNEKLIRIAGPAQLGAGHPEAPEQRSAGAACPMCGRPMTEHQVLRPGGQRDATRLVCPAPSQAA